MASASYINFFAVLAFSTALRICHHNDFHARYLQINRFNSACSDDDAEDGNFFGSVARIKTFFDNAKCDLRVFAGDFVEGSVFDTVFGVNIAIDVYKSLGYNIATFGNHEFNKGTAPVYKTVAETSANMTWIASNVNFADAPANFSVVSAAKIKGVCWVGAVTETTPAISNPGPNVTFFNPTYSIRAAIPSCGNSSAVVAVTHLGYDQDVALCHGVPELDLIIGGHSHSDLVSDAKFPTKVTRLDGSVCFVVTALEYGKYIGVLDIDTSDADIKFSGYAYVPMDARIQLNPEIKAKMDAYKNVSDASIQRVIGTTTAEIDGARTSCRFGECQMGNLVCDAMLAYAGPMQGAVACIQSGGDMRESIDKGNITIEQVLTALPFPNVHAVITLPGSGIIKALENGFLAINDSSIAGRFPQVGGMEVEVDYTGIPGSRVVSVKISNETVVPERLYTIVTNNFMASGGDGYEWEGSTHTELSGRGVDTLVKQYLAENNPYTPFTEGRIKGKPYQTEGSEKKRISLTVRAIHCQTVYDTSKLRLCHCWITQIFSKILENLKPTLNVPYIDIFRNWNFFVNAPVQPKRSY